MHAPDNGSQDNALNITKKQLKDRKVINLDIAAMDKTAEDYKEEDDARIFKSEKTGRGELVEGEWHKTADPVMCCYKLVNAKFAYWGLQGSVEGTIESSQTNLFHQTLRKAFTLIDKWHGLTMEDIRRLEAESKAELNAKLAESGTPVATADDDEAKSGGGAGGSGEKK